MSVLSEFREAIQVQQNKADEAFDEQISLPLDERVAKGVTMTNLKVKFDFYDHEPNQWCPSLNYPSKFIRTAKIYCDNNISKFREGGQVILSNGSNRFKMEIIEDSINNFILAPNDFDVKYCYIDSENYNPNHWEINVVKTDLTLKLLSAVAGNLEYDNKRLNKIEALFNGVLTNPINSDKHYDKLNESQNIAVTKAALAPHFHLIQGPPGTGKTKTIAHIAALHLRAGKKVFITAPTHTAINNCLNAVAAIVQDASKVLKIGEKYQAAEIIGNDHITRKTRLPYDRYSLNNDLSQEGIAIGGTPYCMCYPASKRLNNWEFDIVLIDEAAQMTIPLAVAVMSRSNKFVFVGDHQQLDPIMPSGTGTSMFSESIFRRLVNLYPKDITLLDKSYRLNEELIRIPNALFYENELSSARKLENSNLIFESREFSEALNNQDSKVLYLHKVFDAQGRSPHEAEIIAEIVKDLLSNGVELKDIGILTPYRAQVREIKKKLANYIEDVDSGELFVDTVDRMQGQERDFILYSMANSHPLESKRRLDFFYSPNRLNVAITRAIKKCIVVANYKVFDIIDDELVDLPEFNMLKPSLDIFKKYYKLSSKVEEVLEEDEW